MLRRPLTFVSNRGEALGAPPPGVKRMRRRLVGPRPLQRPREVEGSGEPERGSWSPVHATAASALSTVWQAGPSRAPGEAAARGAGTSRAPAPASGPERTGSGCVAVARGVGDPAALGGEARPGRRRSVPAGRSPQVRPRRRFRSARGGHLAGRRAWTAGPGSPPCGGARCAWGSVSPAHPRIRLEGKHKAAP